MHLIKLYYPICASVDEYEKLLHEGTLPESGLRKYLSERFFITFDEIGQCSRPKRSGCIGNCVNAFGICLSCEITISYPLFLPKNAYMTDDMHLAVSLFFILNAGADRLKKVLAHELGHIALARSEGYDSLLRLNREYLERHGDDKESMFLSPVEYYANAVATELIKT